MFLGLRVRPVVMALCGGLQSGESDGRGFRVPTTTSVGDSSDDLDVFRQGFWYAFSVCMSPFFYRSTHITNDRKCFCCIPFRLMGSLAMRDPEILGFLQVRLTPVRTR
ncbi:hypothetical protein Hanom_Chr16g01479761 [Helianthus anomalus]